MKLENIRVYERQAIVVALEKINTSGAVNYTSETVNVFYRLLFIRTHEEKTYLSELDFEAIIRLLSQEKMGYGMPLFEIINSQQPQLEVDVPDVIASYMTPPKPVESVTVKKGKGRPKKGA